MRVSPTSQSRKRGTLESDLLLNTFARDHLQSIDELREYDKVATFLLDISRVSCVSVARRSGLGYILLHDGQSRSITAVGQLGSTAENQGARKERGQGPAVHVTVVVMWPLDRRHGIARAPLLTLDMSESYSIVRIMYFDRCSCLPSGCCDKLQPCSIGN